MNKEFVTYKQALALRELGFDEPCIGYYYNGKICFDSPGVNLSGPSGEQPLPLYQQAFRWFREKHKLNSYCDYFKDLYWEYWIGDITNNTLDFGVSQEGFKTYEEAEQACLDKLIEIVKEKTQ